MKRATYHFDRPNILTIVIVVNFGVVKKVSLYGSFQIPIKRG